MSAPGVRPSRRALFAAGAGSVLAACGSVGGESATPRPDEAGADDGAAAGTGGGAEVAGRLRELEREHSARLGVYARNAATGATVLHRADERFPLCSVWKPLAAAAVLRDLDRDGDVLARRIRYAEGDLVAHSPVTGTDEHLADGMTVAELCDAAIRHSDNSAANLLLRELGGPTAITRFARSLDDPVTRLDRWETALNSAEPGRVEDTTSPRAIGRTYARLVLGDALERPDRKRLTGWLLGNTTSDEQFRAGLPGEWAVADKTGSGGYGTANDVGIAWTSGRPGRPGRPGRSGRDGRSGGAPITLAVLTTKRDADARADYPLIAATAALLARALT